MKWAGHWIAVAMVLSAGGATVRAEFTPVAGFDQQLFPSYLIATASIRHGKSAADPQRLGDPLGLLGVEVVSPGENTLIKVTIECDDYFETSVFSGKLSDAEATYRITPKIKYRYDRLAQCEQAAPISVTFRVQLGQETEEEQTVTCTMRSINDCPFAFKHGEEIVDASFAFAAYVNEQHPFVDKLLREALDRGVVKSFHGYQAGKPEDVIRQAYAIWDLLVARDVRYSSITTTAADSDSVACQHVRLLEDSINNSQANCVDGSVLWVSLLRKIGIDGFLVITPNHCYAGFYLNAKRDGVLAIETTLLGAEVDEDSLEIEELYDSAVAEELRYAESFASFVAALEHGTKTLNDALKDESNVKSGAVKVIDIAKVRKQGVLPIGFQNKESFVGYDFTSSATSDDVEDAAMTAEDSSEEADEESDEDWSEDEEETAEE